MRIVPLQYDLSSQGPAAESQHKLVVGIVARRYYLHAGSGA